ncbi:MAG: aminopeptidase [Chitinivibrionales bacterium]
MFEQMKECADIALGNCLKLKRTERLLVVCDPPCLEIGQAFWEVGRKRCREAVMVQIAPRRENGNEPPEPTGEWFGQFDVAVMPTSKSLSHTKARRNACQKGTRIATLPGIEPDVFMRTMKTDWSRLGMYTRKVAAQLSQAKKVRIQTEEGTDFTFETGGRQAKPDDGKIDSKGAFGNLPAGEAYLAPMEGTGEGMLVFDGSFPLAGLLQEPLKVKVNGGMVRSVNGHSCAQQLERLFRTYGQESRTIAEFGVGTLDSAIISGNILEDEKVKGTVHLAIGDNASMGGNVQVPMHLDGIIKSPSVWLDNQLWMQRGELV